MLLGAQMTFGWKKENAGLEAFAGNAEIVTTDDDNTISTWFAHAKEQARFWDKQPKYEQDDGPLTDEQIEQIKQTAGNDLPVGEIITKDELFPENAHTEEVPSETPLTALGGDITAPEEPEVPNTSESELEKWNKMIAEAEAELAKAQDQSTVEERVAKGETYIDGEGTEVPLEDESKKKTYMIKDSTGSIVTKSRE
jgi:hypothetical protein